MLKIDAVLWYSEWFQLPAGATAVPSSTGGPDLF